MSDPVSFVRASVPVLQGRLATAVEERRAEGAAAAAELSAVRAQLDTALAAALNADAAMAAVRGELDLTAADAQEQRRLCGEMQVRERSPDHVHG